MARQAYQEQLLKLNGELIEMGDLCEEAMSLVMKALRNVYESAAAPAAGIRGSEKYLFCTSYDRGYGADRGSDRRYRRCIQTSDRFPAGSTPEDF